MADIVIDFFVFANGKCESLKSAVKKGCVASKVCLEFIDIVVVSVVCWVLGEDIAQILAVVLRTEGQDWGEICIPIY